MEQSFKKPKGLEYYGEDLTLFLPHVKKEKLTQTLLSEDVIAEMKKMSPQNLVNILLPNKNVNRERKQVYMPKMVGRSNNCQGIQKLTQELCKEINKENINKKLSQRKALGWDKVNEAITKAPFCEHNQQIVNLLFCGKCRYCMWNGLCHKCSKNGVKHFLGNLYYKNDYDDIFNLPYNYSGPKKYYYETINLSY